MLLEKITITGIDLPIKRTEIEYGADEAVRQARFSLTPTQDNGLPVIPGDAVTVKANDTLVLTGFVRDVMPRHDPQSHELDVTIVSKTVDATETSVEHASGEVINQPLDKVANEFGLYHVDILTGERTPDDPDLANSDFGPLVAEQRAAAALPPEPRVKLRPGETSFAALERVTRGRGILIYDTPEGRLKLASKPEGTHDGSLRFGVNIERASATLTERGRYSPVIVRGETSEAADIDAERMEAEAIDDTVTRRRPMIIVMEGQSNPDKLKQRAAWAVQRNQGEAISVNLTVTGWRDDAGNIWQRNWLVHVIDPWLGLDGTMAIKTVVLRQDEQSDGTVADLTLVDPRALGGENPRGKSNKAYKAKSKGKQKTIDWVNTRSVWGDER